MEDRFLFAYIDDVLTSLPLPIVLSGPEASQAFQMIKDRFTSAPILIQPTVHSGGGCL